MSHPRASATDLAASSRRPADISTARDPASAESASVDDAPINHAYTIEDGVAIIDGDIAIGDAPSGGTGVAQVSPLTPWPTHEIPYYVQPSLSSPERIGQAIHFFNGTAVTFIPVTNEPADQSLSNGSTTI